MKFSNPSEDCFQKMYKDYGTNEEEIEKDTQKMIQWYKQQTHLPQWSSEYNVAIMKIMLLRCKMSMERAKQVIDMHFTLRPALPEFFANRNPLSAELQAQMDHFEMVSLPRCTKEGNRVYVARIKSTDTSKLSQNVLTKLMFMIADDRLAHSDDYAMGEIYIVDLQKLTMGHVTALSIPQLKKADIAFSKGYCARIVGAHFVNPPPLVELLVPVFFSATNNNKLKARLRVHSNIETLYDYVDKEVLPADYGGNERRMKDLWSDWRSELEGRSDWFIEHEKRCQVDESKRPGKSFDKSELFGMEGTFKQLTVD